MTVTDPLFYPRQWAEKAEEKRAMNIYFARSIRGQHSQGERFFFQSIINTIKECGHVPTMETKAPERTDLVDRDRYIYERDIQWINNSQAMVAEVSNPSLGVGFEICYAMHVRKIPILAVALKDTTISAMICGCSEVFYYRDTSDMAEAVRTFLAELRW